VLKSVQVREARQMIDRGESITHVAHVLRCGRATLYRLLATELIAEQTLAASSPPQTTEPKAAAKNATTRRPVVTAMLTKCTEKKRCAPT